LRIAAACLLALVCKSLGCKACGPVYSFVDHNALT